MGMQPLALVGLGSPHTIHPLLAYSPSRPSRSKLERLPRGAVQLNWIARNAVDPDQDLLDKLDRKEGPGTFLTVILGAGLAALAGLVAYFTLKMELRLSGEIAADAAILISIASAALLGTSFFKFR